ncbi:hypothetical protein [Pseudomonas sp.]|uniref:hypothetical protein n=1 Tax=Pseudomonas sp. TaxID=306 RepID=UPI0033406DEB
MEESINNTLSSEAEYLSLEDRQLWVTAFWGFRPQDAAFVGFSREGDRDRFFDLCKDGDLVLIYGTTDAEVQPEDRKRALGFLEIKKEKLRDAERMSENHREWKRSRGLDESWTYGVRVVRAWEIVQSITIKHITATDINVAVRGVILDGQERKTALSLSVREVNVYGEGR